MDDGVQQIIENAAKPLALYTLTGLVDYIKANKDRLALEECVAQVVSPEAVRLCGRLLGAPFWQRHTYAGATFEPLLGKSFNFGAY